MKTKLKFLGKTFLIANYSKVVYSVLTFCFLLRIIIVPVRLERHVTLPPGACLTAAPAFLFFSFKIKTYNIYSVIER